PLLPVKDYPFTTGDRLISIDGRDAQLLLQDAAIYASLANPIAAKRLAAARITIRPQSIMPHATDVVGTSAKVVIQRLSGDTETYTIPWSVTGTPLTVGPVPSPKLAAARRKTARAQMDSNTPGYMNELMD